MPAFDDLYPLLEDRVSAVIRAADPAAFAELACEIHRFQRRFNEPYDRYCRGRGTPVSVGSWREIPAVPQAAFKAVPLRAFSRERTAVAFHTSGTTGEGYGIHEFCSLRLYDEAILRGWDLLGLPALPQLILIPPPAAAPHSSLSYMAARLAARAPEQHWCLGAAGSLDIGFLDAQLERFRKAAQPVLVLGTALAFLHWCENAPANCLPAGSLAFETGGYKGSGRTLAKPELYARMQEHLGIPSSAIINEYGMTELSSQCYSRGLGRVHEPPPWMRVLVVDPATGHEVRPGEPGVLRIYDLANLGSVLALQTRDLAIRREGGFELLGRDPAALPRGCSRSADEMLSAR